MNLRAEGCAGSYWGVLPLTRFRLRRGRMAIAALTAAGLLVGATACSSSEAAVGGNVEFKQVKPGYSEVPVAKRQPAPNLQGPTLTDTQLALSSMRGKVVVVNFWGSWCAPCRAESVALETVAQATKTTASFVGVAERDNKSAARAFVKSFKVSYPSILDDDGSLASVWPAATGLPYTFVLDKQGRIAARFLGGVTAEDLQAAVTKVAAEA